MAITVSVLSAEEEWRTSTRRVQKPMGGRLRFSYGRVCLWLRLECGHYVQRMVKLDKEGMYVEPKSVRCGEC
jgi:hypothetical protein